MNPDRVHRIGGVCYEPYAISYDMRIEGRYPVLERLRIAAMLRMESVVMLCEPEPCYSNGRVLYRVED